jgi:hypothetical protein
VCVREVKFDAEKIDYHDDGQTVATSTRTDVTPLLHS